ncbi:adenosylcobinamide-GDP ribazoletransferase [Saccharolobus solfataricus]|uniref:Adenosylcobinamide-GDP ribazoletransferase n=3 Tax=Saccharolobus solfataricus TaxID=2287 RepID=COBS_SACS2|nr:adenosylcobinamide-GDP ribazoletransferase [Saccharolobus solfataricus]Q97TZ6.1 RecName: Full=Adenosylcobinamide-GDP ribazoletransferase; AltName: Full=Cobalamin synthase; AltName: Full=Cobalamin-5'-phosphate synthase [Saccharolobus solfataricus P2]AAK43328.1 Cobalamin synthase related protein [Saccharolobus solfataricus P2]AKA73345.1 adenosylcobinamide-GDP ribazoletransferase [Saccharolobus solfataricus]AKA76044.1 adenosylcobinamide-GDP ribazoletransferase [Saccharolobus solfataricus]AKA78
MHLKEILAQFSFFTAIPVKSSASLEEIAESSYISPIIVGISLGLIESVAYLILYRILGELTGIVLLGIIELLRGFNHLDGLLDLGDALMIRGNREKKIKALKDVEVGSGGIGLLLVYLSIQIVALLKLDFSLYTIFYLISSNVLSMSLSLYILSTISPIPESNLGRIFHDKLKGKSTILLLELIPFISLYNVIVFIIFYMIMYKICGSLGGSSGDIAGASITLSFPLFLITDEITNLNYSLLSILCYLFSHLH